MPKVLPGFIFAAFSKKKREIERILKRKKIEYKLGTCGSSQSIQKGNIVVKRALPAIGHEGLSVCEYSPLQWP